MRNKILVTYNLLLTAAARVQKAIGIRGLVIVFASVATAMACSWSYITDRSVRFNSYRTGRGFYRLPPLPIMYDSDTGKELSVQDLISNNEDTEIDADSTKISFEELWNQAREAVENKDLHKAKTLFEQYLRSTEQTTIDEEPGRQEHRNSAYDMIDALTALQEGANPTAVKNYLDARYAFDSNLEQNAEELVEQNHPEKNLHDNWDYLRAAILYSKNLKDDALRAFLAHAAKYPRSEKNEAALFMAARIMMETSYVYDHSDCGIMGRDRSGEPLDSSDIEPLDKCQDENWRSAVKVFQKLIQKYPNGRYSNDSRGWLAFLYKRGSERELALAEYYKLLGNLTDRNARLAAKESLHIIGYEYDDETLDRLEKLIAGDVNTAMAYAYHRIYDYSIDLTYQESYFSYYDGSNEEWQRRLSEKQRVADAHKAGKHELSRIVRFATAMMKRYPQARISGGFVLRFAESQMELQNFSEAKKLASKALLMGLSGELRAQALWIKGSGEHQGKDLRAARATFNQLIAEFPDMKLTEGARRLLALTAEDQGDLETALEQYLALHYDYDVAYFIDVLLPTDRLAKFVSNHANLSQYNELLYALGIRYMRDRRWNEARSTFRLVQTKYAPDASSFNEDYDFSKDPDWDWQAPLIKTSWVMQDLKTIDVLEHLEKAVETAEGDEAKAEALYQLASFQFDANSLLFYNPAAWHGQRFELLAQLDTSDNMRLPGESQMIFEYSQLHETLARAIPIYEEIFDKYPKTKAAKDALFSEAVAQERLADLNPYWREIYSRNLFVGQRVVDITDIGRIYPNFRWPKSRDGWEASTRTVHGGPAYPTPPKPAPKLTLAQRIVRKLGILTNQFSSKLKQKTNDVMEILSSLFRNNVYIILIGSGLLGIWKYRRGRQP